MDPRKEVVIMIDRVTWPHATCVIVSLFLSANMVPHAVISPYKYLSNISIAILSLIIQVPYQNKNVILQWQWASSWATYRTCSLCFTQLDCLHLSRVAAIRVVDLYCRVEDVFASISSTFASCRRLFAMVRPSAAERRPDLWNKTLAPLYCPGPIRCVWCRPGRPTSKEWE